MVLFTITYIVFYCFSQVVFDPLIGRVCHVGVYEHGEIEFAMEALIRVLDSNGLWVRQELSYHKVENVIHNKIVEGIDKSFPVAFPAGILQWILPLTPRMVIAIAVLSKFHRRFLKNYVVVFITQIEPGACSYIDACDRIVGPTLGEFRSRLGASYADMANAHEETPREIFRGTKQEGFSFDKVSNWFYGQCVNASENGCRFIAIHKLPSQCDVSIPQEYQGHYGIDIGGLSNLTYEGNCNEVSEMDIGSMLEKYHENCTENLHNKFDEESDESDDDSSPGSNIRSNNSISSDDSSVLSTISIRSSTSVALGYSSNNSSSDGLIMMRPGEARVLDNDDGESDIEHIALVNPDSPNGM